MVCCSSRRQYGNSGYPIRTAFGEKKRAQSPRRNCRKGPKGLSRKQVSECQSGKHRNDETAPVLSHLPWKFLRASHISNASRRVYVRFNPRVVFAGQAITLCRNVTLQNVVQYAVFTMKSKYICESSSRGDDMGPS